MSPRWTRCWRLRRSSWPGAEVVAAVEAGAQGLIFFLASASPEACCFADCRPVARAAGDDDLRNVILRLDEVELGLVRGVVGGDLRVGDVNFDSISLFRSFVEVSERRRSRLKSRGEVALELIVELVLGVRALISVSRAFTSSSVAARLSLAARCWRISSWIICAALAGGGCRPRPRRFLRRVTQAGQVVSSRSARRSCLPFTVATTSAEGARWQPPRGQQCGREEDGNGVTRTRPKSACNVVAPVGR